MLGWDFAALAESAGDRLKIITESIRSIRDGASICRAEILSIVRVGIPCV